MENKETLKRMKLKSRIMYKGTRGHEITTRQQRVNVAISKIRYKVERTFGSMHKMVWCRNSKIRRTFKNTCAAYNGVHCLQLIPNTRDYGVKLYQIRGKYTDKRLLSTQKVTSSGIFWSKIFILLKVYGRKLRGCRFCRGLIFPILSR